MCPPAATRPTAPSIPKFGQKLDFIERMTRWSEGLSEPTIIVGDFNVAPLECDVWSHKALLNVVSHTPVEVEALTRLQRGARLDRHRPPLRPGAGALLHLVELSLARLDQERPRPPARPYVGLARAGRPSRRAPGAGAVPQLAAAVRPCAADSARSRFERLQSRAIAALRAGRPVRIDGATANHGPRQSRPRRPSCWHCVDPERCARC